MNFSPPTNEQRLAVDSIRKFVQSEIRPAALQYGNRPIPRERMLELHQAIAEFGLPGGALPRAQGGWGLSWVTQAMLFEELVKASAAVAASVLINTLIAQLLLLARPSLRDRYLVDIIGGKRIGGLSLGGLGAEARRKATGLHARSDGDWLIVNGEAAAVANGTHADLTICAVRTEGAACSHLILDRNEHEYEVRPVEQAVSHLQHAARIALTETRVHADNIVGREGGASRNISAIGTVAGAHIALTSVGLMQSALDGTIAFAAAREGCGSPNAAQHLMAARIAEMAVLTHAARLMCQRSLSLMDAGLPCATEVRMAKWFAVETGVRVCGQAERLLGDQGIAADLDLKRCAIGLARIPTAECEAESATIARELTASLLH